MTDETKPWIKETAPPTQEELDAKAAALFLDELKAKADDLEISYAPNIGAETLQQRIAEAEENPVVTPPPPPPPEEESNESDATLQNINAAKVEEPVSASERELASINFDKQAPLEIINMVSQGLTMKEARKKYKESRAGKKEIAAKTSAKAVKE